MCSERIKLGQLCQEARKPCRITFQEFIQRLFFEVYGRVPDYLIVRRAGTRCRLQVSPYAKKQIVCTRCPALCLAVFRAAGTVSQFYARLPVHTETAARNPQHVKVRGLPGMAGTFRYETALMFSGSIHFLTPPLSMACL